MAFDKKEYDKKFMNKKRKSLKTFKVDMSISEFEEIDKMLKNFKIEKKQFLKEAIKNFKEEKKMKKYYIECGTDVYKLKDKEWEFYTITSLNINDEYIGIYTDYEKAFRVYNSIELEKVVEKNTMYADYKQIYEIDGSIEDKDDVDLDAAKLIDEKYSFYE